MKQILSLYLLFISLKLNADPSRTPAVVESQCNLDISVVKIQNGSGITFTEMADHQVIVHSGDDIGCSVLAKKRYADSVYEENARNEMKILFSNEIETYSKKCREHFKQMGLKGPQFKCETPEIISMSFSDYTCEKKMDNETQKITYISSANAKIKYTQLGNKFEEKSVDELQKEQCTKLNECIREASEKELPELKKLASVACKIELAIVPANKAPELEVDPNFNGGRNPKINSDSDQEMQQKNSSDSASMVK